MADPKKGGFGKKFKLPGGKKKANKDISGPRNFRQLTHIGYNKDTGEFEVRKWKGKGRKRERERERKNVKGKGKGKGKGRGREGRIKSCSIWLIILRI